MDEMLKLLKKFPPAKIKLYYANGEDKVFPVPKIHNRWQHVFRYLDGEQWVKLEFLDKSSELMVPPGPIEREVPVAAMDMSLPDDLQKQAGAMGFQLTALSGLAQLLLRAVQIGMEEQRKGNEQSMSAAIAVLNITAARLEGMEKAADKMLRQAFENARAAGAIAAGGEDGASGDAFWKFVEMYQKGKSDAAAGRAAPGDQPGAGPNGQSR